MAQMDATSRMDPTAAADRPYGLLAQFDSVDRLLHAARQVRNAGYSRWDAYTPFAVHGLDDAMGSRPTRLPWIVLAMGLTGTFGGLLLVWWTNAVDYPFLIGGKPIFSLPANVAVVFETTVLLSAFGAVFGMLGLNRLPRLYHPLFRSERFRRVTSDRFFIAIEAADPRFDRARTADFLMSLGSSAIEDLQE